MSGVTRVVSYMNWHRRMWFSVWLTTGVGILDKLSHLHFLFSRPCCTILDIATTSSDECCWRRRPTTTTSTIVTGSADTNPSNTAYKGAAFITAERRHSYLNTSECVCVTSFRAAALTRLMFGQPLASAWAARAIWLFAHPFSTIWTRRGCDWNWSTDAADGIVRARKLSNHWKCVGWGEIRQTGMTART